MQPLTIAQNGIGVVLYMGCVIVVGAFDSVGVIVSDQSHLYNYHYTEPITK